MRRPHRHVQNPPRGPHSGRKDLIASRGLLGTGPASAYACRLSLALARPNIPISTRWNGLVSPFGLILSFLATASHISPQTATARYSFIVDRGVCVCMCVYLCSRTTNRCLSSVLQWSCGMVRHRRLLLIVVGRSPVDGFLLYALLDYLECVCIFVCVPTRAMPWAKPGLHWEVSR